MLPIDTDGKPIGLASMYNDVAEAELGVTPDARRIDLGIGNGPQADMRRVGAFHRHAVTGLGPGRESR